MGSYFWFWNYGGTPSVLNFNYEEEYAKMIGGNGYVEDFPGGSTVDYPYPEWTASDTQYVEASEEAGRLMSNMLSTIPLIWYRDTYAFDSHLKNFLGSRCGLFQVAYSYWDTNVTSTTTTSSTISSDQLTPYLDLYAVIATIGLLIVIKKKRERINSPK